ncbi:hypothetical protein HAT91_02929 [Dickeya solani]|nr:hypothetical protein HAT91_02929 [Dickeya solani]
MHNVVQRTLFPNQLDSQRILRMGSEIRQRQLRFVGGPVAVKLLIASGSGGSLPLLVEDFARTAIGEWMIPIVGENLWFAINPGDNHVVATITGERMCCGPFGKSQHI